MKVGHSLTSPGRADFETGKESRTVGFVQTDKFARLWTETHGEDDLYTTGLLGREKWDAVFHSI
jgi:hypothetical protein